MDMTNHDHSPPVGADRTPLNDNQLYALEQARWRAELEQFTWSRETDLRYSEPSFVEESDALEVDSDGLPNGHHGTGEGELGRSGSRSTSSVSASAPPRSIFERDISESAADGVEEVQHGGEVSAPMVPKSISDAHVTQDGVLPTSALAACAPDISAAEPPDRLLESVTGHTASLTTLSPRAESLPAIVEAGHHGASHPVPISHIKHDLPQHLDLPTGLPGSGLSVSDIISIPSPDSGSANVVFRRHPHIPDVDAIGIARLSIEVHGTITSLDDEEWEELNAEGIGTAHNGPSTGLVPLTFFTRGLGGILKRRPSTLVMSSLRRQAGRSNSSLDSSPTKPTPGLFAAKSMQNTKRAFEKFKVFPKRQKPVVSTPPSPETGPVTPRFDARPAAWRRHTESGPGWFEKRARVRKQGATTAVVDVSRDSRESEKSASSSDSSVGGPVPRVELVQTPPVVWELDGHHG